MEQEIAVQKAKGFLSGAFNTLAGKNGRMAAFAGWVAVLNFAVAFMPPVTLMSVANLICAGCMMHSAKEDAQRHRQKKMQAQ